MKISEINSAIQSATNLLNQLGCKVRVTNAQGVVFKPANVERVLTTRKTSTKRFSHADRNLDTLLKDLEPGMCVTLPVLKTTVVSLQSAMLNTMHRLYAGPKRWNSTKDVKGKNVTIHMHTK
jgi:hypothetical protein